MSIKLTNIISNQVVLLGNIDNTVKLTNEMEADVVLTTSNRGSQWIMQRGWWNSAAYWIKNGKWIN